MAADAVAGRLVTAYFLFLFFVLVSCFGVMVMPWSLDCGMLSLLRFQGENSGANAPLNEGSNCCESSVAASPAK
jgi:hypothetical protein